MLLMSGGFIKKHFFAVTEKCAAGVLGGASPTQKMKFFCVPNKRKMDNLTRCECFEWMSIFPCLLTSDNPTFWGLQNPQKMKRSRAAFFAGFAKGSLPIF